MIILNPRYHRFISCLCCILNTDKYFWKSIELTVNEDPFLIDWFVFLVEEINKSTLLVVGFLVYELWQPLLYIHSELFSIRSSIDDLFFLSFSHSPSLSPFFICNNRHCAEECKHRHCHMSCSRQTTSRPLNRHFNPWLRTLAWSWHGNLFLSDASFVICHLNRIISCS